VADLVHESARREIDGDRAAAALGLPGRCVDLWDVQTPRYPDALVFGPSPGPDPLRRLEFTGYTRSCGCGVRWLGDAVRCWCCGRPA
jgi:hypothetical protein